MICFRRKLLTLRVTWNYKAPGPLRWTNHQRLQLVSSRSIRTQSDRDCNSVFGQLQPSQWLWTKGPDLDRQGSEIIASFIKIRWFDRYHVNQFQLITSVKQTSHPQHMFHQQIQHLRVELTEKYHVLWRNHENNSDSRSRKCPLHSSTQQVDFIVKQLHEALTVNCS